MSIILRNLGKIAAKNWHFKAFFLILSPQYQDSKIMLLMKICEFFITSYRASWRISLSFVLQCLTFKTFIYPDEEKRRPDIFHALKMGKHFRKSFGIIQNSVLNSPSLIFRVLFKATQRKKQAFCCFLTL